MVLSESGATIEVEVKYDVLDRSAARATLVADHLGHLPAAGPLARTRVVDRYLDTIDERLRAAGWTARVRTIGDRSMLQLKAVGAPDVTGVTRRQELEGEGGPGSSARAWPVSPARRRLMQLIHGEPLLEMLVLRQDRAVRRFGEATASVELSLDRLEVLVDDRPVGRRVVLEIEQQTASDSAFRLARAHLDGLAHLASARSSKLAWGMDVARRRVGDDGLPVLAPIDPAIRLADPSAEVGRTILATQVRTMIDRERTAHLATGPEEIRRLRVATRRARATLRAFAGSYAGSRPDRLRRGLRRFARLLNDVRTLDVLIGHLDDYIATLPGADRPAIEVLRPALEGRRGTALATLTADLASVRHRRLLEDVVDFVQAPGSEVIPVAPPGPRQLSDELGGWLWSGFEGLVGWRPILETADDEVLHQLRLEVKRLRDLLLVMTPLAGPTATSLTSALAELQDVLGAMNDAATASAWLREFIAAPGGTLEPGNIDAIERFVMALEAHRSTAHAKVPAAWRQLTGSAGRRRMARLIGEI